MGRGCHACRRTDTLQMPTEPPQHTQGLAHKHTWSVTALSSAYRWHTARTKASAGVPCAGRQGGWEEASAAVLQCVLFERACIYSCRLLPASSGPSAVPRPHQLLLSEVRTRQVREGVVRLAVCRANVQRHVFDLWRRGVGGTGVGGANKQCRAEAAASAEHAPQWVGASKQGSKQCAQLRSCDET